MPTLASSAQPSDKWPMDSEQLTQPPPQKRRKTVAIRIRSTPPQPPAPAEESPAKEKHADVSTEGEKSTPPISVDLISPEVAPHSH